MCLIVTHDTLRGSPVNNRATSGNTCGRSVLGGGAELDTYDLVVLGSGRGGLRLPRTATGKIRKDVVREEARARVTP